MTWLSCARRSCSGSESQQGEVIMAYSRLALAALSASLVAGVSPLAAQQAPLVVEQAPQPQDAGNVVKQGTPIHLATETEMNSHDNHVGDRIDLRVLDAVSLNGHTVIPVGTRAVGEVTLVRKKGMWGKSGRLEFRPLYLALGDRQIPISTRTMTKEHGDTGTAGVLRLSCCRWPDFSSLEPQPRFRGAAPWKRN